MNTRTLFVTGLAIVAFAGTVYAAAPGVAPATSSSDAAFVQKAARAGLAEVAAGQLASSKGNAATVREFGAQMVTDHTRANDELQQIAGEKGIAVPSEPDAEHVTMKARLESLSGAEFDRTYVQESGIRDHKAAIELFTDQATNGSDPELKAFAQKTLPTIEHHYSKAQELAESLDE
jgi:putative membrane protein